ncbi:hypothetical protein [Aestuariispira ectoiniformans]|uniref:hypothetical protein n=1 Tax=Aestuariispira ectoiniformans TaxID=2775080 RepID=UPI00223B667E|nr:hypothetical protein [Aestuariispira ectoiniformans]
MDQQKKKKNSTFRKTLYGTGIGLVIWTALVGVMLTNPQVKSTNPGVFQLVELVTPWLDPHTGERSARRLQLPL